MYSFGIYYDCLSNNIPVVLTIATQKISKNWFSMAVLKGSNKPLMLHNSIDIVYGPTSKTSWKVFIFWAFRGKLTLKSTLTKGASSRPEILLKKNLNPKFPGYHKWNVGRFIMPLYPFPVDTLRRFNAYKTSISYRRWNDVLCLLGYIFGSKTSLKLPITFTG